MIPLEAAFVPVTELATEQIGPQLDRYHAAEVSHQNASLRCAVRCGALILEMQRRMSRNAFAAWKSTLAINAKTIARYVTQAAKFATGMGDLDEAKLAAAVQAWNATHEPGMRIDVASVSQRKALQMAGAPVGSIRTENVRVGHACPTSGPNAGVPGVPTADESEYEDDLGDPWGGDGRDDDLEDMEGLGEEPQTEDEYLDAPPVVSGVDTQNTPLEVGGRSDRDAGGIASVDANRDSGGAGLTAGDIREPHGAGSGEWRSAAPRETATVSQPPAARPMKVGPQLSLSSLFEAAQAARDVAEAMTARATQLDDGRRTRLAELTAEYVTACENIMKGGAS